MSQQPDLWKPALVSGAIFGIASGLPLVGALNCLCCSLIVGAGLMTSWLMVRGSVLPVSFGMAALGGAIAGAVAAVAWGVTELAMSLILQKDFSEQVREAAERTQQISGADEAMRILEGIAAPILLAVFTVFLMALWAPIGLAGGVMGRALFEKRAPVPPEPAAGLDTNTK
jgi:type IV secretory pathway TrbD component